MSVNNDYSNLLNQQKLANANSLFGGSNNTSIAGISGDLMQQWAMLGANKSAYKKMLEAQKTGTIKQDNKYTELLSDKYFNDNYDSKTGKIKKATYTPTTSNVPAIDEESTSGDVLNDMRQLALAAINNPNSLNSTHYDFFEKMRQSIASGLVTKGSSSSTTVTKEEAAAATASKTTSDRLLLDDQRFTVAGNKGEVTYSFGIGTSLEDMVAQINADSAETGVTAEVAQNAEGKYDIKFTSAGTGKDQFVRVDQLQGDLFAAAGSSISGTGTDAVKGEAEEVASGDDTQAAIAAGLYTGKLFDDQTFTIQGAKGAQKFTFEKGATAEDIASAINDAAEKTGVKAEVIYNSDGVAEGLGLLADKAGSGNYIQIAQEKGDLFAGAGKTISVAGSSASKSDAAGPAITNLSDLGRITYDGQTYSFADLVQGGKASLANNPDAALAVLDQALKDIYDGRAVIKDFDPSSTYLPGVKVNTTPTSASNTKEVYNYGSDAMTKWLKQYMVE